MRGKRRVMSRTARIGVITVIVVCLAALGLTLAIQGAAHIPSSGAQVPRNTVAQISGTATGDSWTMYQRDATHNAVLPEVNVQANWQSALGDKINGHVYYCT